MSEDQQIIQEQKQFQMIFNLPGICIVCVMTHEIYIPEINGFKTQSK